MNRISQAHAHQPQQACVRLTAAPSLCLIVQLYTEAQAAAQAAGGRVEKGNPNEL